MQRLEDTDIGFQRGPFAPACLRVLKPAAALLFAACLAACASTPDFQRPQPVSAVANAASYATEPDARDRGASQEPVDWWLAFGGEELGSLVDALRSQNLSLAAARERIAQARAVAREALADRLPSVSASADGGSRRAPDLGGDLVWAETYSAGLSATWDVDIFGSRRKNHRAARLRAEAAALSEEALEQSLIAELVGLYVDAYTLQRRLAVRHSIAESLNQTAAITDQRLRAGSETVTALDVQIARQNAAATRSGIPLLQAQLDLQLHAIDFLLARLPGTTKPAFLEVQNPEDLPALPVGTPADLLRRRPDVALAEASYRAALEDVGAARARRFPALSLTGSINQQSNDLSDLFDPEAMIANLIAGLTAPIFQGGRLQARVKRAEATAQELAADYASSALAAISDVERALVLDLSAQERIALTRDALSAARLSDQIARERYVSGQTSILTLLETRRALEAALEDFVLAEQERLDARINLYLALGGDWFSVRAREGNT